MDLIPWYVTIVRLLVPFLILKYPFLGMIANILVDMGDWNFIHVVTIKNNLVYQNWDKFFDIYSWLFVLYVIRFWSDMWAKKMAIFFFVYRAIGVALFWMTGIGSILFYFPNVFENFVIVCLLIFYIRQRRKLGINVSQKYLLLGLLVIPKLIHEYFQHYLGYQPWELYDIGLWVGLDGLIKHYFNLFAWGSLLYVLPISAILFVVLFVPIILRRKAN